MMRVLSRKFADVKKVLENEFYTNPHFLRAFPHLSSSIRDAPEMDKETGWGESLMFKVKDQPMPLHDVEEQIDKTFIEGYRSPAGPLKWLSQEDKDRIHEQIDLKMDQVEQTGLSRQEILLNKPGGLPLSQDPVFQFLRYNRAAREMLVKPGEEFTAYKVVDYALRQDIGTDGAKVLPDLSVFEDDLSPTYHIDTMLGKSFPQKIQPRDYYWKEQFEEKKKLQDDYFGPSPLVFHNKILPRAKVIRRNLREISLKDIHYKNTDFLSQFMTEGGRIRNRYQTRLPGFLQRKIARTIKHSKNLNLLPSQGFILSCHKLPLVPLHAQSFPDVVIHSDTGAVFANRYVGEVSKLNDLENPNTVEKVAKRFKLENSEENLEENIAKAKELIEFDIQFFPTKTQIEILEAHKFLMARKVEGEGEEMAEKLVTAVNNMDAIDIADLFIREKAADPELVIFMQLHEKEPEVQVESMEQALQELMEMKEKFGIHVSEQPSWFEDLLSPSS